MPAKVLILEDDERRATAMLNRLQDRFSAFEHHVFDSSSDMIRFLDSHLTEAIAISLDHDLPLCRNEGGELKDFGNGRIVADYLAEKPPTCPVVIHSTNSPAAVGMEMALNETGWITYRIAPYDDLAWIDELWFPTIRQAIRQTGS